MMKMMRMTNRLILGSITFIVLITMAWNFYALQSENEEIFKAITFKTETGWGYCILHKGKIIIQQDQIPAIQGVKPFKSKLEANKTANLVLEKIRANKVPTLTLEDINKLEITY